MAGAAGATGAATPPSPPVFVKDVILKHLPCTVCKRCDSKELSPGVNRRCPPSHLCNDQSGLTESGARADDDVQTFAYSLVRGLFGGGCCDAVLFLPVADGGLDSVFREHGTVNLHRRERKLAYDVRVLDGKRLIDRFTLDPLRGER